MLQGQNKEGQGEGMGGGEGDNNGGILVASDSSGASGGGTGVDREDDRTITKGQLGEADNNTFLLDSSPFQEAVPENFSERVPRMSESDSAIVKDDHLDEFVPGMNLPCNRDHPSLPDTKKKAPNPASVDTIIPFFSLVDHEDNSLPDSQDDRVEDDTCSGHPPDHPLALEHLTLLLRQLHPPEMNPDPGET